MEEIQSLNSNMTEVRKILAALTESKKLSRDGMAWLILALDPWHDSQVKDCHGIPDQNTGASVFCSIVQEIQISAASLGIASGTQWDCRIATWPTLSKCIMDEVTREGNHLKMLAVQPLNLILSPVTIEGIPTGGDFSECPQTVRVLEVPPEFTKGPCKMAGMGVEVVNTTAPLTVQGLCTTSRMTQPGRDTFAVNVVNNGLTRGSVLSCLSIRSVPKNLSEMTLIPGTTQWHAKDGAYAVVSLKNVAVQTALVEPVLVNLEAADLQTGGYNPALDIGPHFVTSCINAPSFPSALIPGMIPGRNNADSSIIMLTGLSPETTLTVRARFLLERFPNDQEKEILVLASETASFDPVAIEIYTRVMSRLPPAVPFTENPTGEFFRKMLKTLASVAGPMLLALPHPMAKAAGLAITAGGEYLSTVNKEKKVKKKLKAQQQPRVVTIAQPPQQTVVVRRRTKPLPPIDMSKFRSRESFNIPR